MTFGACSYNVAAMSTGKRRALVVAKALKDDVVRMRIASDQKQALIQAASREGLELSAWLRQLALRAAGVLSDARQSVIIVRETK